MQLLALLKNYFLKALGTIVSLVFLILLYRFLGYEKFLELAKIFLWPTVIIIGMMFFRKVISYLFFSLEEFNFFGNKGTLKDIRVLIEEKAQKKFEDNKKEEERLRETLKLKGEYEKAQGNPSQISDVSKELIRRINIQNKTLQEKEQKITELEEIIKLGFYEYSKRINFEESASYRVGKLVNKDGTVYYVGDGQLLGFPDLKTFNSWGFKFSEVIPANTAERTLPTGKEIPMKLRGFNNPLEQISN